jgi:hypothetical protein
MSGIAVTSIENCKRHYALQTQGYDFREVVRRVGELFGLDADAILIPGKQPQRAQARSVAMLWGGAGIGDDGCRGCKIAWHQPARSDPGGRPRRDACK